MVTVLPPQLQGCAYSNVAGLILALIAFCLYCYNLSTTKNKEPCPPETRHYYNLNYDCPAQLLQVSAVKARTGFGAFLLWMQSPCNVCVRLQAYNWSITLLLLLYDIVAVMLHSLLSLSALKALKTD